MIKFLKMKIMAKTEGMDRGMTTDSNREAFEDGLRLEGTALERDAEYGYYLNIDIENHWQTWQAATAHNKEKLREVIHKLQQDGIKTSALSDSDDDALWRRYWGGYAKSTSEAIATLNEMIGGE